MNTNFDLIIVGGGHAGSEACYIASQFDLKIGLISLPGVGLASAPCNPSIGGVGKGQVVKELDALGGLMPILADLAGIQYRTLNESKGYAVRSTRVQIDKEKYSNEATKIIRNLPGVALILDKVKRIQKSTEDERFCIHVESSNQMLTAKSIILTTGTFLNGKLHSGPNQEIGGRIDCEKSNGMEDLLPGVEVSKKRFKTGTPARIKSTSIDFSRTSEQPSDPTTRNFSTLFSFNDRYSQQVSCYLTHTNSETLAVIRKNKDKSPMYNGQIQGVGARYCPSIEDKAFRYPDKDIHHVFLEPESLSLDSIYPSGISSSLPPDVQNDFIHSIEGLENCEILSYGYAVEYDVVDTSLLSLSLEHRNCENLYFAGQVNGTSGYEEAAAQGFVAGLNAALKIKAQKPVFFSRKDSYIGVMIEDLVFSKRDEPYRLFTSRSENRVSIREDNAIQRMCPYRTSFGLCQARDKFNLSFISQYELLKKLIKEERFTRKNGLFLAIESIDPKIVDGFSSSFSIAELLSISFIDPIALLDSVFSFLEIDVSQDLLITLAISMKYDGYLETYEQINKKVEKLEEREIDWSEIIKSNNISFECKQRITQFKPQTFGQLKKMDGIRPATLAAVAARNY